MKCEEARKLLNDFVDLELPPEERARLRTHVESCSGCRSEYESLARVKKLVQVKVRRPAAPGALRQVILRGLPERTLMTRSALIRAAAAIVAVTALAGGAALLFFQRSPHLAHAEVMRDCLREFVASLEAGGMEATGAAPGAAEKAVLAEIERKTGVKLKNLPPLRHIAYERAVPYEVRGVRGARVDFRCEMDGKVRSESLSVFIVPIEAMHLPGKLLCELEGGGHLCDCIEHGDYTLYCLRSGGFVINVVSDVRRSDFLAYHLPQ